MAQYNLEKMSKEDRLISEQNLAFSRAIKLFMQQPSEKQKEKSEPPLQEDEE